MLFFLSFLFHCLSFPALITLCFFLFFHSLRVFSSSSNLSSILHFLSCFFVSFSRFSLWRSRAKMTCKTSIRGAPLPKEHNRKTSTHTDQICILKPFYLSHYFPRLQFFLVSLPFTCLLTISLSDLLLCLHFL